ncbi:MAG: hypothetical protein M0R70_12625 [Nitrospirae bacterium]|nr:hypothetical protein [Nitrospirota bacterium]
MKRIFFNLALIVAVLGAFVFFFQPTPTDAYLKKANFAYSTLNSVVTSGSTTLAVASGEGSRFPTGGNFKAQVYLSTCSAPSSCSTREILTLSLISADTFTIVSHADEGTTSPSSWPAGAKIQAAITKDNWIELEDAINSKCTPTTIDASAGASPTADQLLACRQTLITNYGQVASNITTTLPATAANLGFLVSISTAQTGSFFRVQSAAGGDMYLDGGATGKNYVQFSAPAVGNYFSCFTFRTGSSAWAWICATGNGTTSTN